MGEITGEYMRQLMTILEEVLQTFEKWKRHWYKCAIISKGNKAVLCYVNYFSENITWLDTFRIDLVQHAVSHIFFYVSKFV